MSKTTDKRAYAQPQPKAASAATSKAWEAAVAAEAHARAVVEAATDDATRQAAWPAWQAALEGLIGTPAPSAQAAAYKLGNLNALTGISAALADPSGVLLSPAHHAPEIVRGGNELEKALLALYLDLIGVGAGPLQPAAPSWRGVGETARRVRERFGDEPEASSGWVATANALERAASWLGPKAPEDVSPAEAFSAAALSETLARQIAESPSGYRNYAINPEGLCELAEAVTSMQRDARALAELAHPAAAAEAVRVAFFPEDGDKPTPPRGPGGGLRPPAADAAALEYVAARRASAEVAHHGAQPGGPSADEAHARWHSAIDALLAQPPASLYGVAVRLGYLASDGFSGHADYDCPLCVDRRPAAKPPSGRELYDADSAEAQQDALRRALMWLHQATERLAAPAPSPTEGEG